MKTKKQKADFVHVGVRLLAWFQEHGRDLPFRYTRDPYRIWICEIIFQQTRIAQGMEHYLRFVERFPDVQSLAAAAPEEVLLYWKGLGYYSRALNIHAAAQQVITEYNGVFPGTYEEVLTLKGVGKYTAAAICSICYDQPRAAVDGNFYRILSRVFADGFDTTSSQAFGYFEKLAERIMPEDRPGAFNEAMMDLGSEICRPQNPLCMYCPLQEHCLAYNTGTIHQFPVKTKKVKPTDLALTYYYVTADTRFLVRQRGTADIWKKLYEFPAELPEQLGQYQTGETLVRHQLTHRNLHITIKHISVPGAVLEEFAKTHHFEIVTAEQAGNKAFPKPLQSYFEAVSSHTE